MVCMREDQRSMRSEIQNMDVFFKDESSFVSSIGD